MRPAALNPRALSLSLARLLERAGAAIRARFALPTFEDEVRRIAVDAVKAEQRRNPLAWGRESTRDFSLPRASGRLPALPQVSE